MKYFQTLQTTNQVEVKWKLWLQVKYYIFCHENF